MAATELEIRFTGDDPEQQAAFDRPQEMLDKRAEAEHPSLPVPSTAPNAAPPLLQPGPSQVSPTSQPVSVDELRDLLEAAAAGTNAGAQGTAREPATVDELRAAIQASQNEPEGYDSTDKLINSIVVLTDRITQLIDLDGVRPPNTTQPESGGANKEPTGLVDRLLSKFDARVNKTLDDLGMRDTRAGKAVSNVSNSIAKRGTRAAKRVKALARAAGKTRIGKAAKSVSGRVAKTKVGQAVIGAGRAVAARVGLTAAATAASSGAATTAATGAAAGTGAAVAGAGLAAALGPVGIAAAATSVAFVGAGYTVKKLSDAVHGVADQLEDLSPAIASVRAQANARQTMAKLDRAERIGPEVAQLEAARDRLSESMYETQTKILELMLKGAPVLDAMLSVLNIGVKGTDVLIAAVEQAVAAFTILDDTDDKKAEEHMKKAIDGLGKAIFEAINGHPDNGLVGIDPLFQEILNAPMAPSVPPPPQPGFGGGLQGLPPKLFP